MAEPLVSIIIVNYNGCSILEKCLESLSKITYSNFEIILVDNNSADDSIQLVKEKFSKVIILKLDSNKGFAEPNNIGARIAKGKYLLFLNNDTVVTENFLTELVKVIQSNEKIAICQSLLLKSDGTTDSSGDYIDELGVVYNSKTVVSELRTISSARGASMIIEKSIFDELGGFDATFFATFEDVDLGWRAWIKGYHVVLAPNSIVYHVGGQTTKTLSDEIAFHGFKNQISMKITNFESSLVFLKLIKFFTFYGFRELKIWFDYKTKGTTNLTPTIYDENIAKQPSLKIIVKSLFWIISNPQYLWKKNKIVNSSRVNSTKYLEKNGILSSIKK